jgi:adenine-specific DNA-methyltransferase
MKYSINQFRTALGTPAYEDDDVLIYSGDSLKMLPRLDNESIPLTVTSPPYNIGKEYERVLHIDEYLDWVEEWAALVHSKTTSTGSFWLNLGYVSLEGRAKAIPLPYLLWDRIPFFMIQEVIWNYGAGVAGKKFFSPRNEKFNWYVKDPEAYTFNLDAVRDTNVKYPNQKKNGKLRCNPLGKNPTDVWQIPKVTSGRDRSSKERTAHPAQFPIELVKRVILSSSNQDDLILDPFLGSGSTIEAALRTGRKAIGFEIDPGYVEMAIQRVKNVRHDMYQDASQLSLLDQP